MAEGISDERQKARRQLLGNLNSLAHAMQGDPRLETLQKCEDEAYDLILGDAGKVFDLTQEKDDVRDKYGRSTFGQSCLVARRLIEKGCPLRDDQLQRLGHSQRALPGDAAHAPRTR